MHWLCRGIQTAIREDVRYRLANIDALFWCFSLRLANLSARLTLSHHLRDPVANRRRLANLCILANLYDRLTIIPTA